MEIESEYIKNLKIPENAFGVFVTIRRSVKLAKYPEDIHGCIGYWSSDYSKLTRKQMVSHILDVSHSALYTDDRRKYFPSIENDLDAIIEIDFMLQPLYNVNNKNGILENGDKFINSIYGLIVESNNGSRATYLPHVFPDSIDWNKLKESLILKAGIRTNTINNTLKNVKFLAYSIIQIKEKLIDVIDSKKFLCKSFIDNFIKITLKMNSDSSNGSNSIITDKFIPYIVTKYNATINKDDAVRNLSTIEVFINCIDKCNYDNKEIINICKKVIKYYIKYLSKSTDYLAKANLISLMCTWNRIIKNDFTISNKIIELLKTRIPNAEEDFERGQIILAIFEYMIEYMNNNSDINIFITYVYEIYYENYIKSLSSRKNFVDLKIDNVFKMNWDSQVLSKLFLFLYHNSINDKKMNVVKMGFFDLLNKIALKYIKLFENFSDKKISSLESNYLVVIFEGITNIIKVLKLIQSENNIETLKVIKEINSKIFKILIQNRWSEGFIYFKDETARLDITGHLLNAF